MIVSACLLRCSFAYTFSSSASSTLRLFEARARPKEDHPYSQGNDTPLSASTVHISRAKIFNENPFLYFLDVLIIIFGLFANTLFSINCKETLHRIQHSQFPWYASNKIFSLNNNKNKIPLCWTSWMTLPVVLYLTIRLQAATSRPSSATDVDTIT